MSFLEISSMICPNLFLFIFLYEGVLFLGLPFFLRIVKKKKIVKKLFFSLVNVFFWEFLQ